MLKINDKEKKNLTLLMREIKSKKKNLLTIRIKISSGESVNRTDIRGIKKEIARLFTIINVG